MRFDTEHGPLAFTPNAVTIAGWTARDRSAVDHHVAELAALGVPPPSTVPLFYRVSAGLLTCAATIQVLGEETSGEVEPLLLMAQGRLWLGLGSDHTDRALETHSVAAAKQACQKPVAGTLWALDDIEQRCDDLQLRSWIYTDRTGWTLYQEGVLAAILPLATLLAKAPLGEGGAMLCGTLGAIGGVKAASAFRMELHDPVSGRRLSHEYAVATLPVVS